MRFVLLKPDFLSFFIDFGPIQLAFSPLLWTPYPGPPYWPDMSRKKIIESERDSYEFTESFRFIHQ